MNNTTLQKIHDISIVAIAEKLGFKLYGTGDEGRRACCPYHDDKHPSLHFSTKRGCFKCFVCGAKGDAIKLVQDNKHLLSPVSSHLSPKTTVCLVEAEKTAVILSVHFPECIWLSETSENRPC